MQRVSHVSCLIIAEKACARRHNPRQLPCQTRNQRDQMLDRNLAENMRFIAGRRDAIKKIHPLELQEYPGRIDVPRSLLAINIHGVAVKA
jgi:hypothetical protein